MVSKPYNGFPASYRNAASREQATAFRNGQAYKPTSCTMCGLSVIDRATIHAHNEDYHHPLDFTGLCFCCHMALHHRFRDLEHWHLYQTAVARGWQPPVTRDYSTFANLWDNLSRTLGLWYADDQHRVTTPPDRDNYAYTLPDTEPDLYHPHPGLF